MNGLRVPIFEKGNILTTNMLETLKELSLDYQATRYVGYSNGILTGCNIDVNDTTLTVGKGIIIYDEQLYFLTNPITISYYPTNEWIVLNFVIGAEINYRNISEKQLELVFTKEAEKKEDAIEICRFQLQQGARLRKGYRNFGDQDTEYDTINEIYADWSGYEDKTISFQLLSFFAKEMGKKPKLELIDFLFCQQIYQLDGKSMNRKAIEGYLNQRLQQKKEHYTNKEIYQKLCEIMRVSPARNGFAQERPLQQRRIIID